MKMRQIGLGFLLVLALFYCRQKSLATMYPNDPHKLIETAIPLQANLYATTENVEGYLNRIGETGIHDRSDMVQLLNNIDPDNLIDAAFLTYRQYIQDLNSGDCKTKELIPKKYWADGIKIVKPIMVYTHHVNIVIVNRKNNDFEEGLYIYLPISSYYPQESEDGFSVTQIAPGIWNYHRSKS